MTIYNIKYNNKYNNYNINGILQIVFDTHIKRNYKCPKGTVDESFKCKDDNYNVDPDTRYDLDTKFLDDSENYIDGLDKILQGVLNDYTGGNFEQLNQDLFNDKDNAEIWNMDEILNGAPEIENDTKLYRGIVGKNFMDSISDDMMESWRTPGSEFEYKGFMSTSDNEEALKQVNTFAIRNDKDDYAICEIHVPKGAHALDMRSISTFPEEQEVLLGRGQKFKVIDYKKNGREHRFTWELIL